MRINLDLGGSKIELILLSPGAGALSYSNASRRLRGYYRGHCRSHVQAHAGHPCRHHNRHRRPWFHLTPHWLDAECQLDLAQRAPFDRDLEAALARPVRLANDANCFALSEAIDGAAENARTVFGAILGTGCGGGLVVDGRSLNGPRGIAGEWGHNPLPWMTRDEHPGPSCWCGRKGCLETWVSGPGMAADHARVTRETHTPIEIAARAKAGNVAAMATLSRHADRLARGLAHLVNIVDPDVLVLGGGLSQLSHLYELLPQLMAPYIFADHRSVAIKSPKWGDASGSRGAARLWD